VDFADITSECFENLPPRVKINFDHEWSFLTNNQDKSTSQCRWLPCVHVQLAGCDVAGRNNYSALVSNQRDRDQCVSYCPRLGNKTFLYAKWQQCTELPQEMHRLKKKNLKLKPSGYDSQKTKINLNYKQRFSSYRAVNSVSQCCIRK